MIDVDVLEPQDKNIYSSLSCLELNVALSSPFYNHRMLRRHVCQRHGARKRTMEWSPVGSGACALPLLKCRIAVLAPPPSCFIVLSGLRTERPPLRFLSR